LLVVDFAFTTTLIALPSLQLLMLCTRVGSAQA